MKLVFDESTLTVGDLEDFEDIAGATMTSLAPLFSGQSGDGTVDLPMKVLRGLVVVLGRKEDPSITADSVRSWPIEKLQQIEVQVGEGLDPTGAAS